MSTSRDSDPAPLHVRKQAQIDRQQLQNRIMQLLVQHQQLSANGSLEDGMTWNASVIASYLKYGNRHALDDALFGLRAYGYVQLRVDEWVKTEAGEDAFRQEMLRPSMSISENDFKIESLTGMDRRGNQSTLTRAALHGIEKRPHRGDNIMVDRCDGYEMLREIAKHFKITPDQAMDELNSGQIHICKGGELSHWGRFHSHGGKGGKWQHLCIKCTKEMRKK